MTEKDRNFVEGRDKVHPCEDCPEVQEQIINRLCLYGHDDIKENPECEEEIIDEIVEHCGCNKLGGSYIGWHGSCEYYEILKEARKPQHIKRKRRNKRERDIKYKQQLKHNAEINCGNYPAYAIDIYGKYILSKYSRYMAYYQDNAIQEFAYYKRFYRRRISKYLKRISNKKVRRYKGDISGKGGYRRLFDYWWELD